VSVRVPDRLYSRQIGRARLAAMSIARTTPTGRGEVLASAPSFTQDEPASSSQDFNENNR